jgi:hypothetical protein
MHYPDPEPLDIPEYEVPEGYYGFDQSLVKLKEGQDIAEVLDRVRGFKMHLRNPSMIPTDSQWHFTTLDGDMSWTDVIDELGWIAEQHKAGLAQEMVGYITYEDEKVLNFRNRQREERPTSGWAYETKEYPSDELIITPVGKLQGEEFSPNLIFKIVDAAVFSEAIEESETLYGEEVGEGGDPIYPPDDYPEEGPVSKDIPVGGTEELERAEMGSEDLRLDIEDYLYTDLEDDGEGLGRVGPRRASLLKGLAKLADNLDSGGKVAWADLVDNAIEKIAEEQLTPIGEPYTGDDGKLYQKWYSQRGGLITKPVGEEEKVQETKKVAPQDSGVSGMSKVSPIGMAAGELNKALQGVNDAIDEESAKLTLEKIDELVQLLHSVRTDLEDMEQEDPYFTESAWRSMEKSHGLD